MSSFSGDPRGARVLGIHAEGPFLSPDQPGMFPPDAFRDYDRALWRDMQAAAASPIRLMTVAAERLTPAQLDELRADGVTLSLGHTNATLDQALAAFDSGVPASPTPSTPCAASTTARRRRRRAARPRRHRRRTDPGRPPRRPRSRPHPRRHPHHRPNRPRLRQRPPGRCPPGDYLWAGRRLRADAESVRLTTGRLAGSALTLDAAVRRAVDWLGRSPAAALHMASEAPRASVGLDPGGLRPGAAADLVLLDPHLHPRLTIVGGAVRWRRNNAQRCANAASGAD